MLLYVIVSCRILSYHMSGQKARLHQWFDIIFGRVQHVSWVHVPSKRMTESTTCTPTLSPAPAACIRTNAVAVDFFGSMLGAPVRWPGQKNVVSMSHTKSLHFWSPTYNFECYSDLRIQRVRCMKKPEQTAEKLGHNKLVPLGIPYRLFCGNGFSLIMILQADPKANGDVYLIPFV